jgi:GT2 family glycosyltransferase/glycosyltransferase involved in cell wall biosynthesis
VVVPVYRGLAVTQACLETVLHALPGQVRLIVVDDASPEPGLSAWLDQFCQDARVTLLRHTRNLGFPAAANAGLEAATGCDVLLLNSDTLLPPGAIERLQQALYSRAELGSVTPFSNEATICSYPNRAGGNAAPDLAGTVALDAMAAKANKNAIVEIPTGIGFCLLMRHDCIAKTRLFRPEIFAQGYGEEVDWCLRARHRGYIHVAATGVFVAHFSGTSFGPAGRALNLRNSTILLRLYPGYDRLIGAHLTADPLAPARRLLDAARFAQARRKTATLLISHHHGGGVRRRVDFEMCRLRDAGIRPILLYPDTGAGPYPHPTALTDNAPDDYPNLRFNLPEAMPELLRLLRKERIGRAVLHHGLGHHPSLRGIAEQLGCEMDIVIHDYASFCPRVHLLGPERRYCGDPDLKACAACVAIAGDETFEGLSPQKLHARSRREFASARQISALSADAARRIVRHFPKILPAVTPWEDDGRRRQLIPPGRGHRRIAVICGIGPAKGYETLLECGQDAGRRNLSLEFVIAGASLDDEKLLETGRIFITGPYRPAELPELLAGLRADLAFIPSIWPETWCFTLTEAWEAGLYTMAFDLGAQAERIAATGNGALLPLGLPPSRINDALLSWCPA